MKPLSLALLLLVGGCAVTRPETVTVLRAAPDFGPAVAAPAGPAVLVAPVMARGVAADRRYAYVDRAAPGEVRQAATLFWEEPPARMLETALVQGLRARLPAVVSSGGGVDGGQRVTVRLDRFEEIGGGAAEASVAFDATVTDARQVTLSGAYCGRATVAGETPSDRGRAFEAAMVQAIEALAADMRSGAAQPSKPC